MRSPPMSLFHVTHSHNGRICWSSNAALYMAMRREDVPIKSYEKKKKKAPGETMSGAQMQQEAGTIDPPFSCPPFPSGSFQAAPSLR